MRRLCFSSSLILIVLGSFIAVAEVGVAATASEEKERTPSETPGVCTDEHLDGTGEATCTATTTADDDTVPLMEWDEAGVFVTYGPQQLVPQHERHRVTERLHTMERYMADRAAKHARLCKLKHPSCLYWATDNECDLNPGFMHIDCAPACFTCDKATQPFEERCPLPTKEQDIWQPGDLGRMFERLANDTYYREQYQLQVIRRPHMAVADPKTGETSVIDYPWILQLDDFLSPDECRLLLAQGGAIGYEPSPVLAADGTDIGSSVRTSSHAWCRDACYTAATTILQRIENLTGVPEANYEHLQLLEYQPGQYYKAHTDFIELHTKRAQGVRILTVFLYLNDVEEGGETNFPDINVTVVPKRGRVVIWPSVLDQHPHLVDMRTRHQAMPVRKGTKFGANAWLHQRDFKTPFANNCS